MGGKGGHHGPRNGGRPRKYPPPSSAFADWLARWLEVDGHTIHDLAATLGISPSTIYNLRNGYFPPGLKLALAIEEASGGEVAAKSWIA